MAQVLKRTKSVVFATSGLLCCERLLFPSKLLKIFMSSGRLARMEQRRERTYQDAISTLNSLQSNAQVRAVIARTRAFDKDSGVENLTQMTNYLCNLGLWDKIEKINKIHVSGTKGKGSTCAYVESILRHGNLKTGLFTSPHLICVRERIKINGEMISEAKFTEYFFSVYDKLLEFQQKNKEMQLPAYFKFLTLVAFHAFIQENVDVAIIEVGIGGRYDCTNAIKNPIVVGITSLGLEHQAVLGNTIEDIAWSKAGIMKRKVPAFTVFNQPLSAMHVLQKYAEEVECPFEKVQPLTDRTEKIQLSTNENNVSLLNASLAIRICDTFLQKVGLSKHTSNNSIENLPDFFWSGLKHTKLAGRFHVIEYSRDLTVYLDGAHTNESLNIALQWFIKNSKKHSVRVLVFNYTGERSSNLLRNLAVPEFDFAIFCPVRRRTVSTSKDNWSLKQAESDPMVSCQDCSTLWENLCNSPSIVLKNTDDVVELITSASENSEKCTCAPLAQVMSNLKTRKTEVLVTGSMHLVGNFLLNLSETDGK